VLTTKGGVCLIDENIREVIVSFKTKGGVCVISIELRGGGCNFPLYKRWNHHLLGMCLLR